MTTRGFSTERVRFSSFHGLLFHRRQGLKAFLFDLEDNSSVPVGGLAHLVFGCGAENFGNLGGSEFIVICEPVHRVNSDVADNERLDSEALALSHRRLFSTLCLLGRLVS